MSVHMDNMPTPSWQVAQRLYDMNVELESRHRKATQARIPSDPNAWQEMRENYEAIILKDHTFSEQHNIEYVLWQLHYRRIEEFRAHISAASASTGSRTSAGVKPPPSSDRISKVRLQFRTFLSEAAGFYHDLILKIRAAYGLPLGNFSEDSTDQIVLNKDGKISDETKKGLVSSHRCLIYLGDLARYKGLYADGGSKSRDYAAASSYYLQATSIWPFSGNPHHQLAILATYFGDELASIYRYFRSLAVDCPFPTAKDNLLVAFEKNRKTFTHQLPEDSNTSAATGPPMQTIGQGKEKVQTSFQPNEAKVVTRPTTGRAAGVRGSYKTFCNYFVRLNGILFTRTSLEEFPGILSRVGNTFNDLLSSGLVEELSFGKDGAKNGLFIVHFVATLIFTVQNVKSNGEGQTYADILQSTVLFQHALSAAFELVSAVLRRCTVLHDPCQSYLLPGILVFVEWLACNRDVVTFSKLGGKEGTVRSVFWNNCITFLNKVLSSELGAIDDENRFALWEDFELRGFLPLKPAHAILGFSRNSVVGADGKKEIVARLRRIISAGKSLVNVVEVDQKVLTFDSRAKIFLLDVKSLRLNDRTETSNGVIPTIATPTFHDVIQQPLADGMRKTIAVQPEAQLYLEGDEDNEEILFRPTLIEMENDMTILESIPHRRMDPRENALTSSNSLSQRVSVPICQGDPLLPASFDASSQSSVYVPNHVMQYPQSVQSSYPVWFDPNVSVFNGLKELSIVEDKHTLTPAVEEHVPVSQHVLPPVPQFLNVMASSGITFGSSGVNESSGSLRKIPVNRPMRHLGPPPGFSYVSPRPAIQPTTGSDGSNVPINDYWSDRYKLPSAVKGSGINQSDSHPTQSSFHVINDSDGYVEVPGFPFHGKQVKPEQLPASEQNGWEDKHTLEHLKLYHEQLQLQQLINGGQQYFPQLERYQGQSVSGGHHPL